MSLIENLNWRYATKKMTGVQVAQDKVDYIVEAARLAPTSSGLQPFRVIQITDPELKAKVQPIAYGQSQIVDASHLLVFAAYDKYTQERIDAIFDQQEVERGLPKGYADDYKNQLSGMLLSQTAEQNFVHTSKQAYLAFGMAIAAAAEQKVDATPMEGFVPADLDKLLGLEELGLKSVTILALGYRDADNDWNNGLKKVRVATEDFLIKK